VHRQETATPRGDRPRRTDCRAARRRRAHPTREAGRRRGSEGAGMCGGSLKRKTGREGGLLVAI
jgi:hypothetical protein